MARKANPQRKESLKRFLDSRGKISLEELAQQAGVPKRTISKWKCEDRWNEQLERQPKKHGGQPGNKNAAGKTPKKNGNRNAVTHGAYMQISYADIPEERAAAIQNLTGNSKDHLTEELKTLLLRREYLQQQLKKYTDEEDKQMFYVDKIVHMIVPKSMEEVQEEEDAGMEAAEAIDPETGSPKAAAGAERMKTAMKSIIKASPFDRAMKIQAELTKVDGRILKAIDSIKSYEIEDRRMQLEQSKYELARQRLTGEIEINNNDIEEVVDDLLDGENAPDGGGGIGSFSEK